LANISRNEQLLLDVTNKMAVETIPGEPLSWPDSLLSGLIQGFFMGFAKKALALSVNPIESKRFLAPSSRLGQRLSREFNFNYQGIEIVYLGKSGPISELRNP
jgi:hypothetical protein